MPIDSQASFMRFVYPFTFDADTFQNRVNSVRAARWKGAHGPVPVWQEDRFPHLDLLPHIREYLNPDPRTVPTATVWDIQHQALRSPYGLGSGAKSPCAEWWLEHRHGKIPFTLQSVQLTLFHAGVGFLTTTVRPTTTLIEEWVDFLHYFRITRGPQAASIYAVRRNGYDAVAKQVRTVSFFPPPAGGVGSSDHRHHAFSRILDALLKTGETERDIRRWWREPFVPGHMLPFAALFIDDVPKSEIPLIIHTCRTFSRSKGGVVPPASELALSHSSLLPLAHHHWAAISLEGAAFLAFDQARDRQYRSSLSGHLRTQYFLLFILALNQRLTLLMLLNKVAEYWPMGTSAASEARYKAFEQIRDTLLSFTARSYFTQVMQRSHHHRAYRKWQEAFQVEQLHRDVTDAVREMHQHLQEARIAKLQQLAEDQRSTVEREAEEDRLREAAAQQRSQRLEQRLNAIGILFGVPALIIGFLGINIRGITTGSTEGLTLYIALAITVMGGVLAGASLLHIVRTPKEGPLTRWWE